MEEIIEFVEAYGYSRKSPDEKESTEISITNQNNLIKNKCNEKGWNLVDIFIDNNVSGYDRNRTYFNKLINLVREKYENDTDSWRVIVTKDQDRFARDSSFFKDTIKFLEARRIKVFDIIKNGFLSSDDIGDNVMSIINEQLVISGRKKAELTKDSKIKNKLPCIPAPFGYKYNFKYNSDKKKIPIDNKVDISNWIINKKESDKIISSCIDYINRDDIKFKDILKRNKINKNKYYRIIQNAKNGLYSGYIYFTHKVKDSIGIVRVEPVIYKGSHPSIISEELFLKLNPDFKYGELE